MSVHVREAVRRILPLLALAVLTGCESTREPVVGDEDPEPIEVAVDTRCEEGDATIVEAIAERLTVEGELEAAYAVRSEDEDVTFVAAELVGADQPDEAPIGIWAVPGDLAAEPDILAVNAIAREYSDWPFDEEITEKVDGGEEALACVEGYA